MIKVQAWGRIAADPELKTVQLKENGETRKLCTFTVLSNRYLKTEPDALRVEVWGTQAENIVKYLKKGAGVAISGDLSIEVYEKEKVKHMSVKVVDADVQFTDKVNK